MERQILIWQRFDAILYQHFNATFWQKVENFGFERMNKEVQLLRDHIKKLHDKCVDRKIPSQSLEMEFRDWIPPGIQLEAYRIKTNASEICYRNALSAMAFSVDIEERQCQDATVLRNTSNLNDREKVPCMWPNVPKSHITSVARNRTID